MSASLVLVKKVRMPYFLPLLMTWVLGSLQLSAASAATVTIAWDRSISDNAVGYKMHYGTSSKNYRYTVDVGDSTICSISGLTEGATYYFAATAYNDSLVESNYSQELIYTIPDQQPEDDTDGDGIFDDDEVNIYDTYPAVADSDGDGIDDGDELAIWGADWGEDFDGDGLTNIIDLDSDADGFTDGYETSAGYDPADPASHPLSASIAFEIGDLSINHRWVRVDFRESFIDPIVVAKPLSLNGGQPAVIRINNIDATGFDIRIQEWEYLDGYHATETVSYLAMEKGSFTLDNGSQVEAGRFETDGARGFDKLNFLQGFQDAPVVLASVSSFNEADVVTGRLSNISNQSFEFGMREQELNLKEHAAETVDYIAWSVSKGSLNGYAYEVGKTGNNVKDSFYTIEFDQSYGSPPHFLADMQTADGGNTANIRWHNMTNYSVEVLIDEEQSMDSETAHTTEDVGYMVFESEQ